MLIGRPFDDRRFNELARAMHRARMKREAATWGMVLLVGAACGVLKALLF